MTYDIYVDGSYKNYGGFLGAYYSAAALIVNAEDNNVVTTLTKVSNDDWVSMRNVAGEILAVVLAFEHCLNVLKLKQEDTARIHYDYAGIANWIKKKGDPGYWKARTPAAQTYKTYVQTIVRPVFKVEFIHTPGHTGILGNETVDRLAKEAMDNHVKHIVMDR